MIRGLAVYLLCCNAFAAESAIRISPDRLDYYLLQAFNSPQHEQRHGLNHIGILGEHSGSGFLISTVLEGYPAYLAGLRRGDVIVSSEGVPFHEVFSFNERSQVPAGIQPAENTYALDIQRGTQSINASVTPVYENLYDSYRSATLSSVQRFSAGNKTIGYVHFRALTRTSNDMIGYQELLQTLWQCDGIVLDLRDSYGFLDVEHFSLLRASRPALEIDAGPRWLRGWREPAFELNLEPYRKPVVLLINENTRGAGELLAFELSKVERVVSLGTGTAGVLGDFSPAESDTAIIYSPALETLVDGQTLEGKGVTPEQAVPYPATDTRRDDPQFESALNLLLGII